MLEKSCSFGAAIDFDRFITLAEARDPVWYEKTDSPFAKDGTKPFARYVIRKKGTVEVGQHSCAMATRASSAV
jgi:hypothetical protein